MICRRATLACAVCCAFFAFSPRARDFDPVETRKKFIAGEYEAVIEEAAAAVQERERGEDWRLLWGEALLMTGRYPEAQDAIVSALRTYGYSIRLRLLARQVFLHNNEDQRATEILQEINELGGLRRWGYRNAEDVVALGRAAVLLGADPRLVLENFFGLAKRNDPQCRDVYLATTELALGKHDFALAAKSAQEGLKKFPDDPDLLAFLAESFAPSDRAEMIKQAEAALEKNPKHIGARLLLADHFVDAEQYAKAEEQLTKIQAVNSHHPEAWAYRAVVAHLRNDAAEEEKARAEALRFWKTNPEVDHILGRKLSQKYRFAEGSLYQRKALELQRLFLPARIQLAQDLLRLGVEAEGWELAHQVAEADAYDVSAFNLVTLHDNIRKFQTISNEHFFVRMASNEAEIFGQEVLDLLERARTHLSSKYGCELTERVTVEIFPDQKDFAVRTFGMPGGEGYLAVCFGDVITANSPSSFPMNWKSVLWHEFAHVITLNLTRNRMPRWFSEGISVYEERLADPRWGERMDPKYREMILEGEMKKISDLSAAFLAPPSGLHLQFAYYQSSLVIEFIVQKFGVEKLQAILRDLGEGKPINESIAERTAPMKELEAEFETYAEVTAKELGSDTFWAKPKRDGRGRVDPAWAALHQENYWVLQSQAQELIESDKWAEARPLLEKSIQRYPGQAGAESAYALLAEYYRREKDVEKERAMLKKWAQNDPEATEALKRLVQIEMEHQDWPAVRLHTEQLIEINPLSPEVYRGRAEASASVGDADGAIKSYLTSLQLDPPDPVRIHFQLADLFHRQNRPEARKHILFALGEAPRFRAGHELLLRILQDKPSEEKAPQPAPSNPEDHRVP